MRWPSWARPRREPAGGDAGEAFPGPTVPPRIAEVTLCLIGAADLRPVLPGGVRAEVIPVYQKAGILPPVTAAVEEVTELTRPPEQAA